jgi:chorismate mutase
MQKLAKRMTISEKIGQYKKENNVTILQVNRWEEIIATRLAHEYGDGIKRRVYQRHAEDYSQ